MRDKYGVNQDPDCYPGTSILKNRLSIKDEDELELAERDFTRVRAEHFEPEFDQFNLLYLQKKFISTYSKICIPGLGKSAKLISQKDKRVFATWRTSSAKLRGYSTS